MAIYLLSSVGEVCERLSYFLVYFIQADRELKPKPTGLASRHIDSRNGLEKGPFFHVSIHPKSRSCPGKEAGVRGGAFKTET